MHYYVSHSKCVCGKKLKWRDGVGLCENFILYLFELLSVILEISHIDDLPLCVLLSVSRLEY